MRDVIAALVAVALLVVAASLATTLKAHRRRRQRQHDSEGALGRTIVAEIPAGDDFILVSEDEVRFYYGDQSVDKDLIVAVRVLINGAPIAAYVSRRHAADEQQPTSRGTGAPGVIDRGIGVPGVIDRGIGAPGVIDDRPEGILRDRWDVAVETVTGTVIIECGAIRERVSPELARKIFDGIKRELEERDAGM